MSDHNYSLPYSEPVYSSQQIIRGRIYAILLLLINAGMLIGAYFLISLHTWWGYAFGLVLLGLFQYIIGFVIPHQGVHKNIFFNSLDKPFTELLLLSVTYTYKMYYKIHMTHHEFVKDPEKDPSEEMYRGWGLTHEKRPWYVWIVNPIRLILTGNEVQRLIQLVRHDRTSRNQLLIFWGLVCVVVFAFPILLPLVGWWLLAAFTTRFWFVYISEVSDHYGDTIWSRNPIGGIFFWCMRGPLSWYDGYHHLHHHDGSIPWFELPHKHRITEYQNKESITQMRF